MQELSRPIAREELKANTDHWLKLVEALQEAYRIEARNDANQSWVSSREMSERLAKRGVNNA